ncbi:hypothetical protein GW17_00028127 [Ensete ventricosum]|nr:hypothetical protein GW17_00028127 [Ensete ventricosum]
MPLPSSRPTHSSFKQVVQLLIGSVETTAKYYGVSSTAKVAIDLKRWAFKLYDHRHGKHGAYPSQAVCHVAWRAPMTAGWIHVSLSLSPRAGRSGASILSLAWLGSARALEPAKRLTPKGHLIRCTVASLRPHADQVMKGDGRSHVRIRRAREICTMCGPLHFVTPLRFTDLRSRAPKPSRGRETGFGPEGSLGNVFLLI